MTMLPKKLHESACILVVEDSDDDYEATKRAFHKANLRNPVHHARSGDEALAWLTDSGHHKPGIILSI